MKNKIYLFPFVIFCLSAQAKVAPKRVLILSWDGMRPEFFSSPKFETPHSRKLIEEGASSMNVEVIHPTLTYPNHVSMVTGVSSAKHGIVSNTVYDEVKGPTPLWYWSANGIQVPTLWTEATAQKKNVATLRWPVTQDAKVKWNVPEVFAIKDWTPSDQEVWEKAMDKDLLAELEKEIGKFPLEDLNLPVDEWSVKAALYLDQKYKPDLSFIHLASVDHSQHESGLYSEDTAHAVKKMDEMVAELMKVKSDPNLCFLIIGDHGHADYNTQFKINLFLQDKTVIKAHQSGSQAVIYTKTEGERLELEKLFREKASEYVEVLSEKEMRKLKIYPKAGLAVAAKIGVNISSSMTPPMIETLKSPRSTHGYLPSLKEMKTAFFASGCGIPMKKDLGSMKLLQLAPTVADLLKIKMKGFEMKKLDLFKG